MTAAEKSMSKKAAHPGITRRAAVKGIMAGAAGFVGRGRPAMADEKQAGIFVERQETGAHIWRVTTIERRQSNIYCEVPYCSADSRYFVYKRSNSRNKQNTTEFVVVEIGTWKQHVLDSAAGSQGCAVSPDGQFYYCKNVNRNEMDLMRVDLAEGTPVPVHRLVGGPWTWSLGTVSSDHHYYLRGKRLDDEYRMFGILLVDLRTGQETIIDRDPYTFNAHPQFDPGDGSRVMIQHNRGGGFDRNGRNYRSTGPEGATLYLVSVPEGKRTELPVGKPYTTPCTGHQAWAGTRGEMILTVSAKGDHAPDKGNLLGVRATGPARVVAKGYKFMHVGVSRCGRIFSCDDWQAPHKILIGSVATGKTAVVCASKTNVGRKQESHPHPYLTPDLKWVIFNSTRTGSPHVYAARVPEGMVEDVLQA